jgi:ABC-2 type transport system permease protein
VSAAGPTPAKVGTIHDQGYQRYTGERLPQSRRFLVIARNVLAVAWKSRWGVKLPLLLGVITLVITAGIMVFIAKLSGRAPGLKPDSFLYSSARYFEIWGFILAATTATTAIADDLRPGPYQFYFARPLRNRDYVIGKLLGLCLLVGLVMFVGPVVLAFLRVCVSDDFGQAMGNLHLILRAAALGVVGTIVLVVPAAGLGAILRHRRAAQAGYPVYYMVVTLMLVGVSHATEHWEILGLSTRASIMTIGRWLFGAAPESQLPPPWAAWAGVALFTALGYAAIRYRIRSAERAGMGGT